MTIEDLEKAVAKLPPDKLAKFCDGFEAFDAARFDEKIERDATPAGSIVSPSKRLPITPRAAPASCNLVARMERSEIRGQRLLAKPTPHCASLHAGYGLSSADALCPPKWDGRVKPGHDSWQHPTTNHVTPPVINFYSYLPLTFLL